MERFGRPPVIGHNRTPVQFFLHIDFGSQMKYIHLAPEEELPEILDSELFKAIVVVDSVVTSKWQAQVSSWLVDSGCRYMMAWGMDCSSWDDSVDMANLEVFDFQHVPEDKFVMTTWHSDGPLEEVFSYAKYLARHPVLELKNLVIVHITKSGHQDFKDAYESA